MRKAKKIILAVGFLFSLSSISVQAQLPDQRDALKGLHPLTVKIQRLSEDAVRDGLDAQQIKTDVELRLRRSGVAIDAPREGPSFPQLYVRVDTQKHGDRYNFSLSTQLMTIVDLDGQKPKPEVMYINRPAVATIWETGGFGVLSPENLEKEIRGFVADQVDQFINDYLAENPKQPASSAEKFNPDAGDVDINAGYLASTPTPTPTPKVQLQKRALPDMPAERPSSATDYANRGNARSNNGDLDGAIADYNKAIELDPRDDTAYVGRGFVRIEKKDHNGAIADFTKAIEINRQNVWAYSGRGDARKAEGDVDGAIADYGKGIEIDPENVLAYCGRGDARLSKGDVDGAIADYTKAIEIDPRNAQAYSSRGGAVHDKGNLDGAIADYSKAIEIDPRDNDLYILRGSILKSKGDLDGAIADYTKAIELDPKDALAYSARSEARQAKGDNDGAIADYRKAIEMNLRSALARLDKGNVDVAIADYTKAIELDPRNALEAYCGRGLVLLLQHKDTQAAQDFKKCFDLHNGLRPTVEKLAEEIRKKRAPR